MDYSWWLSLIKREANQTGGTAGKEIVMSNKSNSFVPFLLGGVIGAAIGILYAPRSGEETRQMLISESQQIKEKTIDTIQETQNRALEAIKEAQLRAEKLNQEAMERLNRLQKIAHDVAEEQKSSLEKGVSEAKDAMKS
jgi:gas vesicle protein